jgi:hypothetical protein
MERLVEAWPEAMPTDRCDLKNPETECLLRERSESLVERTALLYSKGKRPAMTGLEVAEEENGMPHDNVDKRSKKMLHLQ